MRVIAGSCKGRLLRAVRGKGTRPTSARVRESLFGIVGPRLPGSRFLDLFAGTGAVGIEALSRGAEAAVFVEGAKGAQRTLSRNLADLGFGSGATPDGQPVATLLAQDVFVALAGTVSRFGPYDTIFIDPPYAEEWGATTLEALTRHPTCLAPGAWVVLQHGKRESVPKASGGLHSFRLEQYGETSLAFYTWERG